MSNEANKEVKKVVIGKSIGKNAYGYDEVECPNCKKHFYWFPQWKEFICQCGAKIMVEGKSK